MSGSADGIGLAASFDGPRGVAVDPAGNVFVADSNNHTIRKITPAGAVSTFAGAPGLSGHADGTGAAASFDSPNDVAVDGAGNIFVADSYNFTVRKITPAGAVTTFAGTAGLSGHADGTGAAASFAFLYGVEVDGAGNVFVADSGSNSIRKITHAGVVTTLAGDNAGLDPLDVAVDGTGNVFVADSFNHTIRRITPVGLVTTFAGTPGSPGSADGTGAAARFHYPSGVVADAAGNVFVGDSNNGIIRRITPAGAVTTLAGRPNSSSVSADGAGAAAIFSVPHGLAVDRAGDIFVADTGNHTIRKITPAGVVTTLAGRPGMQGSADGTGAAARFSSPTGVAVDGAGNVFVADNDNNVIRKITAAGAVTTLAGTASSSGDVDGIGAVARFRSPSGVAVDGMGNVFVADTGNGSIRKISPLGAVTTLASPLHPTSYLCGGERCRLTRPTGVAVDGRATSSSPTRATTLSTR